MAAAYRMVRDYTLAMTRREWALWWLGILSTLRNIRNAFGVSCQPARDYDGQPRQIVRIANNWQITAFIGDNPGHDLGQTRGPQWYLEYAAQQIVNGNSVAFATARMDFDPALDCYVFMGWERIDFLDPDRLPFDTPAQRLAAAKRIASLIDYCRVQPAPKR